MSAELRKVTAALFDRYLEVIDSVDHPAAQSDLPEATDLVHLRWMCEQMRDLPESTPLDKASRWLGFVQGCLVMHGLISVSQERDFSRPLFHAAYRETGISIPETVSPQS